MAQPLNNSNQRSHVAELLSYLRRDAAAVDAVASFLSTGRWRTKLHDGSPMPVRGMVCHLHCQIYVIVTTFATLMFSGPTGFQVKFAELLHSPNTSLPLDSLAHGFGLQGYLSKRSRDRIDVIILVCRRAIVLPRDVQTSNFASCLFTESRQVERAVARLWRRDAHQIGDAAAPRLPSRLPGVWRVDKCRSRKVRGSAGHA